MDCIQTDITTTTETTTDYSLPVFTSELLTETTGMLPMATVTPGYTTAGLYNPMTPFAPYLSSETISMGDKCNTVLFPQPGDASITEITDITDTALGYPYAIDATVSKPVQETVYSLGGLFTDMTRALDNPVYWVTDSMARQRQRLALIDDLIRQAEMKIEMLRSHATARHATRSDKKMYKHALKDYKKICARRNKVWKTL